MKDLSLNDLKSGDPFEVTCTFLYRWKPYKQGAPKNLLKKGGRWQKMNEYGGWDNVDFDPVTYLKALERVSNA